MPKEHDTSADTFVRHIFQLPLQIYMKTAPFNYKACALLGQGERREGEIIKLDSLSLYGALCKFDPATVSASAVLKETCDVGWNRK